MSDPPVPPQFLTARLTPDSSDEEQDVSRLRQQWQRAVVVGTHPFDSSTTPPGVRSVTTQQGRWDLVDNRCVKTESFEESLGESEDVTMHDVASGSGTDGS